MSLDYEDRGPLSAIKDYAKFNDLDNFYHMTDQIVGEILADGNPEDEEYDIIHYFSSLNFANLEKFVVEVNNVFGDEIYIEDPDECFDEEYKETFFSVSIIITHPKLDAQAIYDEITKLVSICNEFNVAYDGWGTQFEDEEQYSLVCIVIELKADTCMYQLYLSVNHGARMCGLFQVSSQYLFCLRRSKNFQNH